jgi:hypothetical protein
MTSNIKHDIRMPEMLNYIFKLNNRILCVSSCQDFTTLNLICCQIKYGLDMNIYW